MIITIIKLPMNTLFHCQIKLKKIYYEELWYIYMFDQNLKRKLTTIQ